MAGNLNSDSIIWVVGEATGYDQEGAPTTVSGSFVDEGLAGATEAYVDSAVDALHDRLVASGVLPN